MIYNVTTSKGKKKIIIPESWDETNTGQFEKMVTWDQKNLIELFSIMSGLDVKVLENTYDPALEQSLIECTNYVYTPYEFIKEVPDSLVIDKKKFKIPKDVGGLTIGQNILVAQGGADAKVKEELLSLATAIFLQPLYDNCELDYDKALILRDKIRLEPITKIYPVGFFLLNPQIGFGVILRKLLSRMTMTLRGGFSKSERK
jgi:hypothetical protein